MSASTSYCLACANVCCKTGLELIGAVCEATEDAKCYCSCEWRWSTEAKRRESVFLDIAVETLPELDCLATGSHTRAALLWSVALVKVIISSQRWIAARHGGLRRLLVPLGTAAGAERVVSRAWLRWLKAALKRAPVEIGRADYNVCNVSCLRFLSCRKCTWR